ncbi:delta-1-pyrroline-5-carboxylate synthase-like [Lactuca sativa]|uniref:delta-1-pyrroline-5-carboxylate synthase-like n=1 Tax=Lactuca sativa TaxID=4236 RepID=UPI0022AEAA8C|nr:delta-1-pyrroline-5-carboxylate synthase-like [Lactuca sativa]
MGGNSRLVKNHGEDEETVRTTRSLKDRGEAVRWCLKASGGFRGYSSDWSSGYGNIWSSAFLKSGLGSDRLTSSSGHFGNIPLLLTTNPPGLHPHHTVPFCLFIYNHSLPNTLVLINSSSCASLIHHLSSYMPDAQIASLAIRTRNGLLLKGGKEAKRSNAILHKVNLVNSIIIPKTIGKELITLVTSREQIPQLLKLDDVIDLVIPRGSNNLVSQIKSSIKIPVLGHAI